MNQNHIKEVFSDEVFVKSLLELETPAEVQAALKGKGIDMSESEIISLRDEIVKQAQKISEGGELSADQLDDVAGGAFVIAGVLVATTAVAGIIAAVGISASTGLGIGLGVLIGSRRW